MPSLLGFSRCQEPGLSPGRDFNEHDSLDVELVNQSLPVSKNLQLVVIVNEAFGKRYFGGRNPLGAHIAMGSRPDAKPETEIIGVVQNLPWCTRAVETT